MKFRKATGVVTILLLMLLAIVLAGLNSGFSRLSVPEVFRTLIGLGTSRQELILFEFRMPRICITVMLGAGLALSGCIIQGITGNALADPGLLGINAGAGLAVILFVVFFGTAQLLTVLALPLLALVGGLLAAVLIYALAHTQREGLAPMRLILTGIAVQAGISALTMILVLGLDEDQYDFVASWLAGQILGENWRFVIALVPWLLVLIPYVLSRALELDVLNLSADTARSLGVDVKRERMRLLGAAVALAASSVAIGGNISFIGLMSPHISRRLVGPRHGRLIPVCMLVGAILVCLADTLGRTLIQPSTIPTGIMTAILGAPYFIYLLSRN